MGSCEGALIVGEALGINDGISLGTMDDTSLGVVDGGAVIFWDVASIAL